MNVSLNLPGYMEIRIEEKYLINSSKKLPEGWEHLSLKDINRILRVIEDDVW